MLEQTKNNARERSRVVSTGKRDALTTTTYEFSRAMTSCLPWSTFVKCQDFVTSSYSASTSNTMSAWTLVVIMATALIRTDSYHLFYTTPPAHRHQPFNISHMLN